MGEILVLILIGVLIMSVGIYPVFAKVHTEKNPSPWAFKASSDTYTTDNAIDTHAAIEKVNVDIPSIVSFEKVEEQPDTFVPLLKSLTEESTVSEPDEELWGNVATLLESTMSVSTEKDLVNLPESEIQQDSLPSLPVLTKEQYSMIKLQYGEKVANLITCTPYKACLGEQIMIGTFFKDGNLLKFDSHMVELVGNVEEEISGETIVVKGSFLEDSKFYVQHWEDPEMVEQGYSSFTTENLSQVN